jgi:hypothetical protein
LAAEMERDELRGYKEHTRAPKRGVRVALAGKHLYTSDEAFNIIVAEAAKKKPRKGKEKEVTTPPAVVEGPGQSFNGYMDG